MSRRPRNPSHRPPRPCRFAASNPRCVHGRPCDGLLLEAGVLFSFLLEVAGRWLFPIKTLQGVVRRGSGARQQVPRPRSLNSTQGILPASSGQPANSLRASCRCSACWVCRYLRPLVGGCKYTGRTTGVEHHKVFPRSLVRADPRHQYTPQNHGPRAWFRVATGVGVRLPELLLPAPSHPLPPP